MYNKIRFNCVEYREKIALKGFFFLFFLLLKLGCQIMGETRETDPSNAFQIHFF